jgi:phosphate transport system substrate-binding protein
MRRRRADGSRIGGRIEHGLPLSDAVALDFMRTNRNVTVNVAFSGTVTGFQKFCRDQTDVTGASRPITRAEQDACAANGVSFVELPVAHDALTVIVNPKNTWATAMTVADLRTLWSPDAERKVTRWNQIRSDWPDREIILFGPGIESGTFDYFTEVVNGTVDASRADYTASADDGVIVHGVAANETALGYIGYSHFERNRDRLTAVAIDDLNDDVGRGPIGPSPENVGRGVYRPFSRPLFIYMNLKHAERPAVKNFVQHYLRHAGEVAASTGAIPMMATANQLAQQRLSRSVTGTMYTADNADMGIEYLLTR